MFKIIWNWIMWRFCRDTADKLLAINKEVVQAMDARQKLAYALNAAELGLKVWPEELDGLNRAKVIIVSIRGFINKQTKMQAIHINKSGNRFKLIARGILPKNYKDRPHFILPGNMELAYAFWSITRILAIVFPGYPLELEKEFWYRSDVDEVLTKMATSVVSSVAAAYGHDQGVKAYGKIYREMIEYGVDMK